MSRMFGTSMDERKVPKGGATMEEEGPTMACSRMGASVGGSERRTRRTNRVVRELRSGEHVDVRQDLRRRKGSANVL